MSETKTEKTKSADVPTELLDLACDRFYGTPSEPGDDRRGMAHALAAVLPAVEAKVRRELAIELLDELDNTVMIPGSIIRWQGHEISIHTTLQVEGWLRTKLEERDLIARED